MAFFMKNPDSNERRTLSVSASTTFGTLKTLADVMTEDARFHANKLNYTLDQRSSQLHCHRRFITFFACNGFKPKLSIKSSRVSSQRFAPSTPLSWNVGARCLRKDHVRMTPHLQLTMTQHLQLRQVDAEELRLQNLAPPQFATKGG